MTSNIIQGHKFNDILFQPDHKTLKLVPIIITTNKRSMFYCIRYENKLYKVKYISYNVTQNQTR